eukprot:c6673_g1_i1.p1 GENE.c6673_g1_i1~~c6673_g1_i1.p1  ORF type:complete len:623 (-),score=138.17 c6673_g1_i1:93-1961(-)
MPTNPSMANECNAHIMDTIPKISFSEGASLEQFLFPQFTTNQKADMRIAPYLLQMLRWTLAETQEISPSTACPKILLISPTAVQRALAAEIYPPRSSTMDFVQILYPVNTCEKTEACSCALKMPDAITLETFKNHLRAAGLVDPDLLAFIGDTLTARMCRKANVPCISMSDVAFLAQSLIFPIRLMVDFSDSRKSSNSSTRRPFELPERVEYGDSPSDTKFQISGKLSKSSEFKTDQIALYSTAATICFYVKSKIRLMQQVSDKLSLGMAANGLHRLLLPQRVMDNLGLTAEEAALVAKGAEGYGERLQARDIHDMIMRHLLPGTLSVSKVSEHCLPSLGDLSVGFPIGLVTDMKLQGVRPVQRQKATVVVTSDTTDGCLCKPANEQETTGGAKAKTDSSVAKPKSDSPMIQDFSIKSGHTRSQTVCWVKHCAVDSTTCQNQGIDSNSGKCLDVRQEKRMFTDYWNMQCKDVRSTCNHGAGKCIHGACKALPVLHQVSQISVHSSDKIAILNGHSSYATACIWKLCQQGTDECSDVCETKIADVTADETSVKKPIGGDGVVSGECKMRSEGIDRVCDLEITGLGDTTATELSFVLTVQTDDELTVTSSSVAVFLDSPISTVD